MEKRGGFSWGERNIPGRRIIPGEIIVVYNDNGMPNITAKDLVTPQPFVIPKMWEQDSKSPVENLENPTFKEDIVVFEMKEVQSSELIKIA